MRSPKNLRGTGADPAKTVSDVGIETLDICSAVGRHLDAKQALVDVQQPSQDLQDLRLDMLTRAGLGSASRLPRFIESLQRLRAVPDLYQRYVCNP